MSNHKRIVTRFIALLGGVLLSASALAGHSWSTYHWARTSSPMPL